MQAGDQSSINSRVSMVQQHLADLPKAARLFDHQVDALRFMLERELDINEEHYRGGIIADEVGVGKTIQAIALILANPQTRTLIVMPTAVLDQWLQAFTRWAPELKVYIAHGKGKLRSRGDILDPKFASARVVLTSYGMIYKRGGRGDDYKTLLHDVEWDRLILDEAHAIANGTLRSRGRASLGLSDNTRHCWALTATPIVNRERDMVSLMRFVGVSQKEYNSSTEEVLNQYVLRRTKLGLAERGVKELDLPGLTTEIVPVDWASDEEAHFYHVVQGDIRKELERMRKYSAINITEILELLCRLKQASVHPQMVIRSQQKKYPELDIPDWTGKCSKIEALVKDIKTHGLDSVVFTEYTVEAEAICDRLREEGCDASLFNGSTSQADRRMLLTGADIPNGYARSLAEINTLGKRKIPAELCLKIMSYIPPKVLVVNKKSCGVGLNLQRYSRSYELIPSWSPAEEDQAIGRSYRLGQTKPVVFKKFILRDGETKTIDDRIIFLQKEKRAIMAKLLQDEKLEFNGKLCEPISMKLNMEDIINLIS